MTNKTHILKGRRRRRGMTLVEAMLSVGVLSIGFLGIVGLLTNVSAANRKSAFHNYALDVFSELEAQLQNAPCDLNPAGNVIDPGLVSGTWYTAALPPASNTAINYVGTINVQNAAVKTGATSPVLVAYYVRPFGLAAGLDPSIQGSCGPGLPCTRPDVYRITIMICDLSDKHGCGGVIPPAVATDEVSSGYWVRSFTITKTCTIRLDDSGRGEFYP